MLIFSSLLSDLLNVQKTVSKSEKNDSLQVLRTVVDTAFALKVQFCYISFATVILTQVTKTVIVKLDNNSTVNPQ